MRILKSLLLITIVLISACSPTKQLGSIESDISQLYQQAQYEKVLLQYEKLRLLSEKNDLPLKDTIQLMAGKAAHKIGNYDQSTALFQPIVDISDKEALLMGGINFEKTGQIPEEYNYWLANLSKFEDTEHHQEVLLKLYRLEQQLQNYAAANKTWSKIEHKNDPDLMFEQVTVLTHLNKTSEALALCNGILKIDDEHEQALFWKADYYYNKAENWYQSEMTKYNRDANYTTYAYLRRELKKISADFRTARGLLETLHEISPDNKKYLRYLINTYVRLEMKNEVDQMTKKLNAL
jgi:tetratricopeptide (TPR) repeat protein